MEMVNRLVISTAMQCICAYKGVAPWGPVVTKQSYILTVVPVT